MALKFYTSVKNVLKLKIRKFRELIPTFVEVTENKLVKGNFLPLSFILNMVKGKCIGAVHGTCNLRFNVPNKIPVVVFHNG